MNDDERTGRIRRAAVAALIALLALPAAAGSGWTIDWWTIDAGGEVFASGGSWELSGTVGQWDATADSSAVAGTWELTSGFWASSTGSSDRLFSDDFE